MEGSSPHVQPDSLDNAAAPRRPMARAEREQLARLARQRAKVAKDEAVQREKVLLVEVQDLITAEFDAQDELWADAVLIAEVVSGKANEQIAARCAEVGIPEKHAPRLELGWRSRSPHFENPQRRAELVKLAQTKLTALTATTKVIIDRKLLETETALVADSLESEQALAFLAAMPTAEQLMPALTLDDLGVTHWQPPDDAAAALLRPSTPADRKRRKVRRAIEANPDASDRRIAELADCDHKTVAKYRRHAGELPAADGEFPNEDQP
jgi:hypothetical protein